MDARTERVSYSFRLVGRPTVIITVETGRFRFWVGEGLSLLFHHPCQMTGLVLDFRDEPPPFSRRLHKTEMTDN